MVGFITLHRALLEWEWYKDTNTKSLFIHCLLKANWEAKKWQGIEIKRGQFVTSISSLSEELGLTTQQVRTAISKLIKTNELTSEATNKHTLLTVVKYDVYQNEQKESNKQHNKPPNKRSTNKQQTDNNQITTTNNYNNIINKPLQQFNNEQEEEKMALDVPVIIFKEFESVLVYPYESEDFLINWGAWKKNKKEVHKFKWTDVNEQAALNKLSKLAKTEKEAIEIIQESLAQGWKGFFELKNKTNGTEQKSPEQQFADILNSPAAKNFRFSP